VSPSAGGVAGDVDVGFHYCGRSLGGEQLQLLDGEGGSVVVPAFGVVRQLNEAVPSIDAR
jgi:hypothetical protein